MANEVSWPTVGVCWVLTTSTTLIFFAVVKGISYLRRRKRRKRIPVGGNVENGVPLLELKCTPRTDSVSTTTTRVSNLPSDRRKQDDVSRWCSDHNLPESLVYYLREQGFVTRDALDALKPEDLENLQLPSIALLVQLRTVLTKIHGSPESSKSNSGLNQNQPKKKKPSQRSIGDYYPTCGNSPDSSDVFIYPSSSTGDEVDAAPRRNGNPKRPNSSHSQPKTPIKENSLKPNLQPRFHGLLSDEGLWQLTELLGHEWQRLAALLKISPKTLERLTEKHHNNIQNAMYEMLTMWRDNSDISKEQMKGQLHDALIKVGRKDIANKIMNEQLHGSVERVHKLTSII